jgi:small subunit ribosomal protein S1
VYELLLNRNLVSFPLTAETRNKVDSLVSNINSSYFDEEIYETTEEKAVAFLYFIIKDHPFIDGNKRTACLVFQVFCDINFIIPNFKNFTLELPIIEANKGGLIVQWQGISGFLPASQLKTEHYPRVADGDKDKILEELKKLVGTKISVSIISAIPKEGKLIFSEKTPESKDKEKIVGKYKVDDVIEGTVTGIVDFGVFVKLEDGLEGLVHISEIDWSLIEDPRALFKVGQKIKVKVIEIKEGKVSLSLKALKENPWVEASKKYKKDQQVQGVVIKFNKHGALASIEEGIAGLVHISEFGSEEKLRKTLALGKSYDFKITLFDVKEQKMALSFIGEKK